MKKAHHKLEGIAGALDTLLSHALTISPLCSIRLCTLGRLKIKIRMILVMYSWTTIKLEMVQFVSR